MKGDRLCSVGFLTESLRDHAGPGRESELCGATSPPCLSKWSPELWREATVFNRNLVRARFAGLGDDRRTGQLSARDVLLHVLELQLDVT